MRPSRPVPPDSSLHSWQGRSLRWYGFTIYPIYAILQWIGPCNYIFARPRFDSAQSREALYIGEKGDTDRFERHEKLEPARRLGATELHVYFGASSRFERLDIETDLRNGHLAVLNAQPTRAAEPLNKLTGLLGLGAAEGSGGLAGLVQPIEANGLAALCRALGLQ